MRLEESQQVERRIGRLWWRWLWWLGRGTDRFRWWSGRGRTWLWRKREPAEFVDELAKCLTVFRVIGNHEGTPSLRVHPRIQNLTGPSGSDFQKQLAGRVGVPGWEQVEKDGITGVRIARGRGIQRPGKDRTEDFKPPHDSHNFQRRFSAQMSLPPGQENHK